MWLCGRSVYGLVHASAGAFRGPGTGPTYLQLPAAWGACWELNSGPPKSSVNHLFNSHVGAHCSNTQCTLVTLILSLCIHFCLLIQACWLFIWPLLISSAGPGIWGPERMGPTAVQCCRQSCFSFSALLYTNVTKKTKTKKKNDPRKAVWVQKTMIRKTCKCQ